MDVNTQVLEAIASELKKANQLKWTEMILSQWQYHYHKGYNTWIRIHRWTSCQEFWDKDTASWSRLSVGRMPEHQFPKVPEELFTPDGIMLWRQ